MLYALVLVLSTAVRVGWRARAGDRAIQGKHGWGFLVLAFLGLWILFAAGQVGGGLSHR